MDRPARERQLPSERPRVDCFPLPRRGAEASRHALLQVYTCFPVSDVHTKPAARPSGSHRAHTGVCDDELAACYCNGTYGRINAPLDAPPGVLYVALYMHSCTHTLNQVNCILAAQPAQSSCSGDCMDARGFPGASSRIAFGLESAIWGVCCCPPQARRPSGRAGQ